MKKFMSVGGLFAVCFAFGYFYFLSQFHAVGRDPAAINGKFDLSNLQGDELSRAIRQRILTGLQFQKNSDGVGITLGHFAFLDAGGEKKLACREYSKVVILFEAQGSSIDGEKPEMEVEGRCNFSSDMALISPLFLPISKIIGENPGDGEFQFNNGSKVTVKFSNLAEEWPRTWILKSVKLMREKGGRELLINSEEVSQYFGHPMVLTW